MHGTRTGYQHAGCRCIPCTASEAAYHARYAKGLIEGWVSADAARQQLLWLRSAGIGLLRAAQLTGIGSTTLFAIRSGQRRSIHPSTERAILAVQQPSLALGSRVSQEHSYQTREHVRRLVEEQYSLPWLQSALSRRIVSLRHPSATKGGKRVTVRTWQRVQALYDRLLFDDAIES